MTAIDNSVSFYFFDIDDNLLFLPTRLYLWNAETKQERSVNSGDFARVQNDLGRPGPWAAWSVRPQTFRDFGDRPDMPLEKQSLLLDIQAVITGTGAWRGPSWPLFMHALSKQRPIALISARGHAPSTVEAALNLLATSQNLPEPNILAVYTVNNESVRAALGATDPTLTVPSVKKMAIKDAVTRGLQRYGSAPAHRFGISDDDPNNVVLAISAMRDCKEAHPDKRFFVINTNAAEYVKLEVFPMMDPVTARQRGASVLGDSESDAATSPTSGGNTSIYVSNMDRAVKFYTEALGLRLRTRIGNEWAEFDAGQGMTIGLHPANPPATPAPGIGGAINIELKVSETLEKAVEMLKGRGVTFKGEILNYENVRLARLSDPDGNDLLIAQVLFSGGRRS